MEYIIMRKNEPITIAQFADDGNMIRYSSQMMNAELAPLEEKNATDWLKKWWKERSIPIKQGKVEQMLQQKGLLGPEDYLVKNLGLSLTDYYWIKPLDSNLTWKEVNLFENNFRGNLLYINEPDMPDDIPAFTPNSSLQGQLEKSWMIDEDNNRVLVKGNKDHLSSESINEIIAAKLHELQGYDNYTPYDLIKIKGKEYDYGCCSKAFTNMKKELVSAYGVVTSEPRRNDVSTYEHFISVCGKHEIDKEQLRADLEYQIMADFILSGRDRHLSNISILRDADTLKFIRMAPLYDSGKSLFVQSGIPVSEKELLSIRTNSFASTELKLLNYVTNRSLIHVTKLPSPEYIREMYRLDSQMDTRRTELICEAYERKIEKFRDFQLGHDLEKLVIPMHSKNSKTTPAVKTIGEEDINIKRNTPESQKEVEWAIRKNGELVVITCKTDKEKGISMIQPTEQNLIFTANQEAMFVGEKNICDRLGGEFGGTVEFSEGKWTWQLDSIDSSTYDAVENFAASMVRNLELE